MLETRSMDEWPENDKDADMGEMWEDHGVAEQWCNYRCMLERSVWGEYGYDVNYKTIALMLREDGEERGIQKISIL